MISLNNEQYRYWRKKYQFGSCIASAPLRASFHLLLSSTFSDNFGISELLDQVCLQHETARLSFFFPDMIQDSFQALLPSLALIKTL